VSSNAYFAARASEVLTISRNSARSCSAAAGSARSKSPSGYSADQCFGGESWPASARWNQYFSTAQVPDESDQRHAGRLHGALDELLARESGEFPQQRSAVVVEESLQQYPLVGDRRRVDPKLFRHVQNLPV
jgi:hypothetical protein